MADKRPVARSGNNEGMVDYATSRTPEGVGQFNRPSRQCKYLDRIATLKEVFTPEE